MLAARLWQTCFSLCIAITALVAPPALEAAIPEERRPVYAPVGVRDMVEPGRWGWNVFYRYSRITEDGDLEDDDRVSASEVLDQGWELAFLDGVMQSHLFGVEYAPHRRVGLSLEIPLLHFESDYLSNSRWLSVDSKGVGDLVFNARVLFMENQGQRAYIGFAMRAPTGSIRKRDHFSEDPSSGESRLAYPMQLGSGSWMLGPLFTLHGTYAPLSWGLHFRADFPLNDNDQQYRVGNQYRVTSWLSYGVGQWLELSARAGWEGWNGIQGHDPNQDPRKTPSSDPNLQGGYRFELGPGLNLKLPYTGGQRLAIEYLWPVYQKLNGPQPRTDGLLYVGWNWAF